MEGYGYQDTASRAWGFLTAHWCGKFDCSVYLVYHRSMAHNLVGRQFGMLTVVRKTDERTPSKKVLWEVRCSCGGTAKVITSDLLRSDGKNRISCGCMNFRSGPRSSNWKSPNDISMRYWNAVRESAYRRGLDFLITIEYAYSQFTGECRLSGRQIELNTTASLDRIDSTQGYVVGNIQWLHKDINRLKSNWTENQFLSMCREVALHKETMSDQRN